MIIGLDIGTKRVGVAGSFGALARPLETFERGGGKAERAILDMIGREEITTIVVGLPLGPNGERTKQCEDVETFCRRLTRRSEVTIKYHDEHLSSQTVQDRLCHSTEQEIMARKSGLIDAHAAAVILQDYLDSLGDSPLSKSTSVKGEEEE